MSTKRRKRTTALLGILIATLTLAGSRAALAQTEIQMAATDYPVKLLSSPFSSEDNPENYRRLAERLGVDYKDEKAPEVIMIMVIIMINDTQTMVSVPLGDLVVLTGEERHMICAYLCEGEQGGSRTGMPTYRLPYWKEEISIPPRDRVRMRLAFILKPGEHTAFSAAARFYALFSHRELDLGGVTTQHSLAVSSYHPEDVKTEVFRGGDESDIYARSQPTLVSDFDISPDLTREAVDRLRFPATSVSPAGRSIYLEYFLGELGRDPNFPYWIGVAKAIDEGRFDYKSAMRFLDLLWEYTKKFPSGLACTSIWLSGQKMILAPTQHHVYIATSADRPFTADHDVVAVLLFVARMALKYGIDPSNVAPVSGTYREIPGSDPTGFEIDCAAVHIEAKRTKRGYNVKVTRKVTGSHAGEAEIEGNSVIFEKEYVRKPQEY